MSGDLEKVVGALNNTNTTLLQSMEYIAKYREGVKGDVRVGAEAMNRSSAAQLAAIETMNSSIQAMESMFSSFQEMSTAQHKAHSKNVESLGGKMDRHTEVVTKLLTTIASSSERQDNMAIGIKDICSKMTRAEGIMVEQGTRLTTIEIRLEANATTGASTKDTFFKVGAFIFAFLSFVIALLILITKII